VPLLLWFHVSRFGGYQGITCMTNRLRKYVWWPNMQAAVVDFINSCPICNAQKPLPMIGSHQSVRKTLQQSQPKHTLG